MTCGSCHLDGGSDGQTWLGEPFGPRNTPSLRGIRGTQPFHWSGDFPSIQDVNEIVIRVRMSGTGIDEGEIEALGAFIDSLTPIPSPARTADGKLTPEAVRGAAIFQRAECVKCHVSPRMTDRQLHDVGTGAPTIESPLGTGKLTEKRGSAYKTPSLRELWLTAPYLHDGRAKTLREILTTYNKDDRHGKTSGLSDHDLGDLEAFLLSLPLADRDRDQLGTR
jgi:cytochrome c peroxidase